VKTTIKVPKIEAGYRVPQVPQVAAVPEVPEHGPFVDEQPPVETVREIRVHGNASLTDEEELKLAALAVGEAVTPSIEKDIEQRLKASRRFETVEVRKRYRSLDDPTDVALVLVVHERPGVTSAASGGGQPPSAWRRVTSRLMFFPIVNYADGYGLTYGGRVSTLDLLGAGERLSVPLTWGGTRRAALELERTFKTGPLTRVFSSVGIRSQENPRFNLDDRRVELQARAERQFLRVFRTGAEATRGSVSFGDRDDRLWTLGADAALDTRADPAFPRNAVLLGGGWSALHVRGGDKINRYTADARGYVRLVRQNVLAARVQYYTADATLPPYERLLLGGASNLRGFRAGAFDGDRMVITTAELRAPITSVLSSVKVGLTVFVDAAKTTDAGSSLGAAEWRRGAGAGLFFIAPLVRLNLDVAHGFTGGTRLNVGTGFSF
jgi:outer membrane protein assembly factor BamA